MPCSTRALDYPPGSPRLVTDPDSSSGRVGEFIGSSRGDGEFRCPRNNCPGERMFRFALRDTGGGYDLSLGEAIGGKQLPGFAVYRRSAFQFVQEHRVHGGQRFQIEAAFDDGSLMRRSSDGSENCQWGSSRNAACSGNNHNRKWST